MNNKSKNKQEKGITLIALVVTIVVLLILAGVSISLVLNNNGVISKAKDAKNQYAEAQTNEEKQLNEVSDWIDTKVGDTTGGDSVTKIDGVPIPEGFVYVGGTKASGLVISDATADKEKYKGQTTVGTDLVGNQFVWIPVEANNYKKMDLGKANANWEKQTNTAELPQIQKYGGFYIGRYEAGTSEITLSTGIDFAGQNTASGWQNSKFSIRNGLNQTSTGKITQKAGEIPYYHADYETALKLCNDMYQTEYIQSGLVTGTMWDAMMKFIAGGDDRIITSLSSWGNYNNGNVKYTIGNGRYAEINPDNGEMTSKFTTSDGQYHYGINTTAMSEDVKKKNIYDAAGNLWEWTQEASYPNNKSESYMLHGGSFKNSFSVNPACYRGYGAATGTHTTRGFRPALYIK